MPSLFFPGAEQKDAETLVSVKSFARVFRILKFLKNEWNDLKTMNTPLLRFNVLECICGVPNYCQEVSSKYMYYEHSFGP